MRKLLITATTIVGLMPVILPAVSYAAYCDPHSQICVNQECDPAQIGTSTMDYDHKNIVVCLLKNNGSSFLWKAMTQGQTQGFPANYPPTPIQYGPTCYYATDANSNVYMHWNSPDQWIKTTLLIDSFASTDGNGQVYACLAQPSGITMLQCSMGWGAIGDCGGSASKTW
jgi:hypothetical protein